MAYIYKITNQINGKMYVGKTMLNVEERFKEHKKDSKRERCKDRPLYKAMNKYGIENFIVEAIEECSSEQSSEREIFWIKKLNTYHDGYNATIGGDGKPYLDYELICNTYLKLQNIADTAKACGCCSDSVRNILQEKNIFIVPNAKVVRNKLGKPIIQMNLNDEEINEFSCLEEAASYLIDNGLANGASRGIGSHIREVCNNKRKTAYRFKWKWKTD